MSNWIKIYLVSFVIFIAIDFVWLAFVAKNLYAKYLGYLMTQNVIWWAAVLFYFLFAAGLVVFVIDPALKKQSLQFAIYAGAFFGLVAYSTYDLTNLSTIKNWPLIITIIDLCWGTFVSALTSGIAFTVLKKLL